MHNRRRFIKNGAAGLALATSSLAFPMEILRSMRYKVGPNDTINIGLIGCKGMGFSDLTSFLKQSDVNVIALCDVDQSVLRQRTQDLEKAGIKNQNGIVITGFC
jgi:hypothetical protein